MGRKGPALPSKVKLILIKNNRNYGYAEGNNIGVRMALVQESSYVLLLNNDVVVDPSLLNGLVLAAERDECIGFVGPKVYFYDFFGRTDVINFAGGRFCLWTGSAQHLGLKQVDRGQFNNARLVDFIEGSCLLTRKETITRIGLLRADYFAYWEDVEWCLRGATLGYKSLYVPSARIWHKIGVYQKKEKSAKAYYYFARNLLLLAREYAGAAQLVFFLSFFLTIRISAEIAKSIVLHRSAKEPISFVRGAIDGLRRH